MVILFFHLIVSHIKKSCFYVGDGETGFGIPGLGGAAGVGQEIIVGRVLVSI